MPPLEAETHIDWGPTEVSMVRNGKIYSGSLYCSVTERYYHELKRRLTMNTVYVLTSCYRMWRDGSLSTEMDCGNKLIQRSNFFFFLLMLLRCIVMINQSLIIKLKWPIVRWSWMRDVLPWETVWSAEQHNIHLFLWAFWADLVILPVVDNFFSTPFITPTATVWRMSRTAKRPAKGI